MNQENQNAQNQHEPIATFKINVYETDTGVRADCYSSAGSPCEAEDIVHVPLARLGSGVAAIVDQVVSDAMRGEIERLRADYNEAETQRQELSAELETARNECQEALYELSHIRAPRPLAPETAEQPDPTTWNCPVGTEVIVKNDCGEDFRARTTSLAFKQDRNDDREFVMIRSHEGHNYTWSTDRLVLVTNETQDEPPARSA